MTGGSAIYVSLHNKTHVGGIMFTPVGDGVLDVPQKNLHCKTKFPIPHKRAIRESPLQYTREPVFAPHTRERRHLQFILYGDGVSHEPMCLLFNGLCIFIVKQPELLLFRRFPLSYHNILLLTHLNTFQSHHK